MKDCLEYSSGAEWRSCGEKSQRLLVIGAYGRDGKRNFILICASLLVVHG